MNQCDSGSLFLQLVDQANFLICFCSVLAAVIAKDSKWFYFAIITTSSYFLAVYFHCDLKSFDHEKTYRYLFWVLNDLLWLYVIYLMWEKGNIYHNQFCIALLIAISTISMHLFRYVDRHFFELEYSTNIYKTILPTVSSMLAICCWLPAVKIIKRKLKKWNISLR